MHYGKLNEGGKDIVLCKKWHYRSFFMWLKKKLLEVVDYCKISEWIKYLLSSFFKEM